VPIGVVVQCKSMRISALQVCVACFIAFVVCHVFTFLVFIILFMCHSVAIVSCCIKMFKSKFDVVEFFNLYSILTPKYVIITIKKRKLYGRQEMG